MSVPKSIDELLAELCAVPHTPPSSDPVPPVDESLIQQFILHQLSATQETRVARFIVQSASWQAAYARSILND